jgi:hypothetical protein
MRNTDVAVDSSTTMNLRCHGGSAGIVEQLVPPFDVATADRPRIRDRIASYTGG